MLFIECTFQHSFPPSLPPPSSAVPLLPWHEWTHITLPWIKMCSYTFNPLRPSWNEILHLNAYEGKKTWKIPSQVCGFVLSLSLCEGTRLFIWAEAVNTCLRMRSCWIVVSCSISLWCCFSVKLLLPMLKIYMYCLYSALLIYSLLIWTFCYLCLSFNILF